MKKRFFLVIVTFVLALVLSACTLTTKDVELGATLAYNHEMVEKTAQKVTVEVTDKALELEEMTVTYTSETPEIAEISVRRSSLNLSRKLRASVLTISSILALLAKISSHSLMKSNFSCNSSRIFCFSRPERLPNCI